MGAYDIILTGFNITSQVNKISIALRLLFTLKQWMTHIRSYRVAIKKLITATDKML